MCFYDPECNPDLTFEMAYTEAQVTAILMFGRLEGAPLTVKEIERDLKAHGQWPQ